VALVTDPNRDNRVWGGYFSHPWVTHDEYLLFNKFSLFCYIDLLNYAIQLSHMSISSEHVYIVLH
jgi:hypothetical protein